MKWLHFILSHSIFVAVCSVALTFQTTELLHYDVPLFLYAFVFFATVCSYNFYWVISRFSFSGGPGFWQALKKDQTAVIILALSSFGMIGCYFKSGLLLLPVMVAIILTTLYSIPLLPFKFLQFARKAGVLKTILLAFTWTYVTAFLPIQKDLALLSNADIFIISRRFLFMLMLCIIFDNRDKAMDKIRGLRSLATDLKPNLLLLLIVIIFITLFGTNFLSVDYGISYAQSIALQVSTVALLVVYFFSTRRQGYLFYYFLVDGLMLFSSIATFIASI